MSEPLVKLRDIDASIQISLRYASEDNFLGKIVDGYAPESKLVLSLEAALQIQKIQQKLKIDGFELVVYDAYRPQIAVDDFVAWSEDLCNLKMKDSFYPYIDKAFAFDLGYIARKSGHSRGSTIDLSIIKLGELVHPTAYSTRVLNSGKVIPFLDDGTVDMGSSFDLMDETSFIANDDITPDAMANRAYLQKMMLDHDFRGYSKEWWHFTLNNEPYPDTYFAFPLPLE
jgi:D-alanyl-D-alanine dipeptidase